MEVFPHPCSPIARRPVTRSHPAPLGDREERRAEGEVNLCPARGDTPDTPGSPRERLEDHGHGCARAWWLPPHPHREGGYCQPYLRGCGRPRDHHHRGLHQEPCRWAHHGDRLELQSPDQLWRGYPLPGHLRPVGRAPKAPVPCRRQYQCSSHRGIKFRRDRQGGYLRGGGCRKHHHDPYPDGYRSGLYDRGALCSSRQAVPYHRCTADRTWGGREFRPLHLPGGQ